MKSWAAGRPHSSSRTKPTTVFPELYGDETNVDRWVRISDDVAAAVPLMLAEDHFLSWPNSGPISRVDKDDGLMNSAGDGSTTADGRYVIVSGRRWRATDPAIPEPLRQELVNELMAARRLVCSDPGEARPRVQDAKVALGERGDPWWEPTPEGQRVRLAAAMRVLLRHRRPDATICPSDAARVVGGEAWRDLMDTARDVAGELSRTGFIVVRQQGKDVDISAAVGPIRLARGPTMVVSSTSTKH